MTRPLRRARVVPVSLLVALMALVGIGFWASQARAENVISTAKVWSTAATANTDIFSSDVALSSGTAYPATAMRLTIALVSTDSVVNVQVNRTVSGVKTAQTFSLNGGTALTAGDLYTFTWGTEYGDGTGTFSYNVQCATTTTAGIAFLQEVR